jgi:hypothetical protein
MISRIWLLPFLVVTLTACAHMKGISPPPAESHTAPETASVNGWRFAQFRFNWPVNAEPAWHRDALLAHRVIAPVLAKYGDDLPLWRFHRRAARDAAGHQFSFIFFSSTTTARLVFQQLQGDALLKGLQAEGAISRILYDEPTNVSKPRIEDTSDPQWSAPVQKSWPHYMTGVSRTWLDLVVAVAREETGGEVPETLDKMDDFYRRVDAEVSALWLREGQHAFLHHLNAVFGYKPLIVYERRQTTF